jgi:hypothetical protein
MFRLVPLLVVPVILYNFFVLGGGVIAHHDMYSVMNAGFALTMFSQEVWRISTGDLILLLGFVMLFVETVKATGTTPKELFNHGLSMLLFVVCLVEFIVLKGFSTSSFFFLTIMTLFDTVAGYTITVVAAKRDLNLNSDAPGH